MEDSKERLSLIGKIKQSQTLYKLTGIILPLLLLIFPLAKVDLGIDLADAGYNLGNFQYLDGLQDMWYLSTYLANLTGHLLMTLPFGDYMIGMRFYTALIVSIMALLSYWFCRTQLKINKWFAFAGNIMAIGLCWCPTVILYNYLTYLFLTGAVILLYMGLVKEKKLLLFFAGALLGCNIMVRLPNALEAGFILALFYYAWLQKTSARQVVQQTLSCVAGCFAGYGFWLVTILASKGPGAYLGMLQSLFGVSDSAEGYSMADMLLAAVKAYTDRFYYMKYLLALFVAGMVFEFIGKHLKQEMKYLLRGIYLVLTVCILYYLKQNNLFQTNYSTDSAYIVLSSLFLLGVTILAVKKMLQQDLTSGKRLQVCLVVLLIWILPFGSNNNIYPVVNCLFLIAPVAFAWIGEKGIVFPVRVIMAGISILLLVQSIGVGCFYVFGDGKNGAVCNQTVYDSTILTGMKTTTESAEELETAIRVLNEQQLADHTVILYGDIPGLAYYLGMEPAINTTWPDLQSYATDSFRQELEDQEYEIITEKASRPVVIIGKEYETINQEKETLLKTFMEHCGYRMINETARFTMYR
ncbi:MAG: hypothetical protein PHP50_05155 [Lachnospiraceae bacterium]|nr:hypothetical protein [Lachnospiraceae bacterium]